jgi:hypothetical protein
MRKGIEVLFFVAIETSEIFFDQDVQPRLFSHCLAALDPDLLASGPSWSSICRNSNKKSVCCEVGLPRFDGQWA